MHMRYLDLSYTGIECLPDSVSTLYNLETLLLSGCRCLTILPENMSNLINLRQLDISGSTVTSMPPKFGKLKSLQVLTNFTVGNARGSKISELGKLSKLHGTLSIGSLQNVIDAIEASHVQLKSKKYLHELEFKWSTTTHDEESETNVLDMLEPHENVKRLLIQNFGGKNLPNWLGNSPFSSMVFLQLTSCEKNDLDSNTSKHSSPTSSILLSVLCCRRILLQLDDNNPRKITTSVRHLSYLQGIYDDPEKFEIFSEFKQLRTFIPFKFSYFVYSSSITSMVSILLPKLKRLRVLSLSHIQLRICQIQLEF